jgi:hypothetical protein
MAYFAGYHYTPPALAGEGARGASPQRMVSADQFPGVNLKARANRPNSVTLAETAARSIEPR